ncbi:MAG: T9SS type A sorting domain-containing protein [Flavobacterium sp.]|nr:MAG: T9SS type A sorting domain-containing protein [Flavobacterium sp.]
MKKLLLSLLLVSGAAASAQVLQTENFNGLTLGDVGTDITGTTPGQDGWLTFSTNGAAPTTSTDAGNANFQVVANGYEGQGLQLNGPNGNKGSRFLWKDGFADLWAGRTEGNEITEVEFDFYTGAATASTGQAGIRLYGTDETVTPAVARVLNGFVFNSGTKILQGVAYLNNAGTFGTYLITLATGGLTLTEDTWYRLGLAYDTTTGECIWKVSDYTDNLAYTGLPEANWAGPFSPDEMDFVYAVPNTNTTSASVIFDNVQVEATPAEALLGNAHFAEAVNFSVYPNPANSVVNVSAPAEVSIKQIVMTDLNGRTVKTVAVEGVNSTEVSISDLASGMYMLKVVSDKGTAVQKIIKN